MELIEKGVVKLIASIRQVENGYIAEFERHLKHPVEQVWAILSENEKLEKWFSELQIDDLREGGAVKFNMPDGTFEELKITELRMNTILEYMWGEDRVRFELYPEHDGCLLILKEKMNKITDHTSKDLAGWHVCLDVIIALMDGKAIQFREEEWKKWYEKYVLAIREVTENENLPKS